MFLRFTTGSQWVVKEDVFKIHNWFTVGREGGCFLRFTTGSQWVVKEDVFKIHNWFTVGHEGGCF